VKTKVSNQQDFFPEIDPTKKPDRPERFPGDYEEDLEEDCLSCGKQYGIHTTKEIVICALKELRGEPPKGQ